MKTVLMIAIFLTGCGSFNTTYVNENIPREHWHPPEGAASSAPVVSKPTAQQDTVVVGAQQKPFNVLHCDKYIPPVYQQIPELPIEQLKRIDPKDHKAINSLLVAHIDALRQYALENRKKEADARARYLSSCHYVKMVK